MVLVIGEILFDCFPEYRRIGGAPFNFAFHLKKLGLPVRFVSRVGDDEPGRAILAFLVQQGFDERDVQVDPQHETGSVQVRLDGRGVPTFEITADVAYDHIEPAGAAKHLTAPGTRLLYFGSLAQRTRRGFATIQKLLAQRPRTVKSFYDINLRPGGYDDPLITASLKQADLLKMNRDELLTLADIFKKRGTDGEIVSYLMKTFDIETVSLTLGAEGSEMFTGGRRYRQPPASVDRMADTVGAGDAYAAMIALGYLQRWPAAKTIAGAGRFAARLCGVEGALLTDDDDYRSIRQQIKGG